VTWRNSKPQSLWREFSYIFHQVRQSIEPALSLRATLDDWNDIAYALAESPRKRINQTTEFFEWV
jgi:hypothetical protein